MKHRKRRISPNRCWCKAWKMPGAKEIKTSERRQRDAMAEQMRQEKQ